MLNDYRDNQQQKKYKKKRKTCNNNHQKHQPKKKMEKSEKIKIVRDAIKTYPNFPKEGITYRDIFGVFQDPTATRVLRDLLVDHALFLEVDAIVGLDSRGFLLGPLISAQLGKPFIPIRKKGKLPGEIIRLEYTLEYGEAVFEVQRESIKEGIRVLIVDDLLATGGSMEAAVRLLKSLGAVVVECLVVMELESLKGRDKIQENVYSFVKYD